MHTHKISYNSMMSWGYCLKNTILSLHRWRPGSHYGSQTYPVTASHTQKRLKLNSALKLQKLTTSWWFQPL